MARYAGHPVLVAVEHAYLTDPLRRGVEHWHYELDPDKRLAVETVRAAALEGRWVERRQAYWRGVQDAWLRQSELALVQQRISELQEIKDLRDQTHRHLRPTLGEDGTMVYPYRPRSYEGAVKAYVQLDAALEAKREAVLETINPLLGRAQADAPADARLPYTHDELQTIAGALLAARRQKQTAALIVERDAEDDAEDEDEDEDGDGLESA
jgi:hypothetical protein